MSATEPSAGRDWLFWSLLVAMAVALLVRLAMASSLRQVMGDDSLVYMSLARSLAEGRGAVVDYVLWHFEPYRCASGRPEDFISPGFPLLMAATVRLFGDRPFSYLVPGIVAHTVALPLVVRALGRRWSGRPEVGDLAAWFVLFDPLLYRVSQIPMTDVVYLVFYLAAVVQFLKIPAQGLRAAAAAGLALGLAILTRTMGGYLLVLLPLCHACRRRRLRAAIAPEMAAMVLTALAVNLPWLIRNQVLFGSPTYSIYSRVVGFVGRADRPWYEFLGFWWGQPTPTLAERYLSGPDGRPLVFLARSLLKGLLCSHGFQSWGSLWPLGMVLVAPAALHTWRSRRELETTRLLLVLMLALVGFVAVVYLGDPRYAIPAYGPALIAAAWSWREWTAGDRRQVARVALLVVWLAGGVGSVVCGRHVWVGHAQTANSRDLVQLFATLDQALAEDVVLAVDTSLSAAEVSFELRRPTVQIPWSVTPEQLDRVVAHYGITVLLLPNGNELEPALADRGWRGWQGSRRWRVWEPLGSARR